MEGKIIYASSYSDKELMIMLQPVNGKNYEWLVDKESVVLNLFTFFDIDVNKLGFAEWDKILVGLMARTEYIDSERGYVLNFDI